MLLKVFGLKWIYMFAFFFATKMAMADAAEKADRNLMVGYGTRCAGKLQSVKQVLLEGALGVVRQINLSFCLYRSWFGESNSTPGYIEKPMREYAKGIGLPFEFMDDWGHTWYADPAKAGGGLFIDDGTYYVVTDQQIQAISGRHCYRPAYFCVTNVVIVVIFCRTKYVSADNSLTPT